MSFRKSVYMGLAAISVMALSHQEMISDGIPAGPKRPYEAGIAIGYPRSAKLTTPDRLARGFGLVSARRRTDPAARWGPKSDETTISICSPRSAVTASAPPRKGMNVALAFSLRNAASVAI